MKFRTEIEISKARQSVCHRDAILTMGSCFADHIAQRLKESYFSVLQNPFGTLYNPLSIAQALAIILDNREFSEDDLFFYQDEWHSFWHHSSFSGSNKIRVLQTINEQIRMAHRFLPEAQWLFLTFGTAFVYYHLPENRLVANCHKLPEKQFVRKPVNVETIVQEVSHILSKIRQINPDLKILCTVSPIRHLRDGLVQNQQSKATLLLAVHELIRQNKNIFYFPAYEIMMDDLRDYRFYAANLTHPNEQAIQYLWEKFSAMFFTEETVAAAESFAKLYAALNHRVRNPHSAGYRKFLLKTKQQIEMLAKRYPYTDLTPVRQQISEQLSTWKDEK